MAPRMSLLLVPALLATALASALAPGGFQLLSRGTNTAPEVAARAAPGATLLSRAADLDAPKITVVKPGTSSAIKPPVDIDLRFQAAPGAKVNPGSLKILYGFLKLDVTKRILGAPGVEVSADGLKCSGAQLKQQPQAGDRGCRHARPYRGAAVAVHGAIACDRRRPGCAVVRHGSLHCSWHCPVRRPRKAMANARDSCSRRRARFCC